MADPKPTVPAAATPAKRINVLKFNLAGHIPVNTKDVKTIVKASDLFAAAIKLLRDGGAIITKDEDPTYTTVSADSGEE